MRFILLCERPVRKQALPLQLKINENMNTNFTIKNFRVFDENGVSLELKPITILTGANSTGKSSIVRAITLINQFLYQIKRDKIHGENIELSSYKIEFNKLFCNTLGNFESVIHRGSNNRIITFEYEIHSTMFFQDVKVSFSFIDEDEGKGEKYMHNGILSQFSVKTLQDEIIYISEDGKERYNLNLVKEQFSDFVTGEFLALSSMGYYSSNISDGLAKLAKREFEKFDESRRHDILRYLRNTYSNKEPIMKKGDVIESINNIRQFFQIPVIDDCLANLRDDEVIKKVEEILEFDERLSNAEKSIIIHFIKEIIMSGNRVDYYWEKEEERFLSKAGEDEDDPISKFLRSTHGNVVLPNYQRLSIKQDLWENNPEKWSIKGEDISEKAKSIEQWKNMPITKFAHKYEILMRLNSAYSRWKKVEESNKLYSYIENYDVPAGIYEHSTFKMLCNYASKAIEMTLFPVWCENFSYIGSNRAIPKRIYTSAADGDFYDTLNEYLVAKTEYENYQSHYRSSNKNNYIPDTFLNYWIGEDGFEIGRAISIESKMGAIIIVKILKNDGSETYLSDEGYGLTQLVSILIRIETAILKARGVKYNNYLYQSDLDGLNTLKFYFEQQTIAIEEPEIHLHPAFQSKLADMFVFASKYNIHFIVETHSEYLVRRIQRIVAEMIYQDEETFKKNNIFKIVYCPRNGNPYDMRLNMLGRFTEFFDDGFFDVASKDAIAVSKMERSRK